MSKLSERLQSLSTPQQIGVGAGLIVVIAAVVVSVVLASGSSAPQSIKRASAGAEKLAPSSVTTTTGLTVPAGNCPLTDVHAPGGVPYRPALAVKIGNEPGTARPQSGLNEADIVFDTPAEGFIMRYVAVYQCNDATRIGPNRSVRWVDWHLVRQFYHPILAFAGGINPNVNGVMHFKWMDAQNLLNGASSAGIRTTDRSPPDNLYTSTAGLYGLSAAFTKSYGVPPPIFRYSAAPTSSATPAASMKIDFSYGTDVTWTWNGSLNAWAHSYGGGPDVDALTGSQVTTSNVVVLVVKYKFGRYIESRGGSGDFESATTGHGAGYILRNGTVTKVTWSRKYITQPWTFTDASGTVVALTPGRTWVELVPNTTAATKGNLTITP